MQQNLDNDNLKNNTENAESGNIEEIKKALAEAKSSCEANLAGWQRVQADYMNLRRITEQEKAETCKYANAVLLFNLLPVIDDFARALAAVPPDEAESQWVEGLRLIDRKFRDILEKQGVTQIKARGEEFDPRFMEALACGKGKRDVVTQEIETGYMLNDKVIRPAKVVVGSGEE